MKKYEVTLCRHDAIDPLRVVVGPVFALDVYGAHVKALDIVHAEVTEWFVLKVTEVVSV